MQSLTEWVEDQRLEVGCLIFSSLASRKKRIEIWESITPIYLLGMVVLIEMWFCEIKDDDYLVKDYGYTSSLDNWLQLAWASI